MQKELSNDKLRLSLGLDVHLEVLASSRSASIISKQIQRNLNLTSFTTNFEYIKNSIGRKFLNLSWLKVLSNYLVWSEKINNKLQVLYHLFTLVQNICLT